MRHSVHLSCISNECNITKQIVKHIVKHIETYQHQEIIKNSSCKTTVKQAIFHNWNIPKLDLAVHRFVNKAINP